MEFRQRNLKLNYQKSRIKIHAALRAAHVVETMKDILLKYKKPIIITLSVILLQLIFGFDPKFTLINIIWLFV